MTDEQLNQKITEVSKTIYHYCVARTPTREEAEDLSQDILCELIKSSGNIRDDTAFYAFMWGVADNVYKQWCRKRSRRQYSELTDDIPTEEGFRVNMPVYTADQYARVQAMAECFVAEALKPTLDQLYDTTVSIMMEHTPKHLQDQVETVAYVEKHTSAVSLPALRLVEKGQLIPNWHAGEMPTTYIVLSE